jgi:uncharacterized protein (UPF0335 family)
MTDAPELTSNSDPNANLRTLVERIERIEDEKDAMASDIRDIYVEAKDQGYDTKVLRAVIRRRTKDRASIEAFDNDIDRYESALGVQ